MNVLISLHKGYGLGDAVQMSAVLRHVKKYRPEWVVDFQAERGRESVGFRHVRNVFCYGEPYPSSHYDAEVQIVLYDTYANWHDRPNTRVTSCLHERFGLRWDPSLARYEIHPTRDTYYAAKVFLARHPARIVAVHTLGDSAKHKKDLTEKQTAAICEAILALGCHPLLLDWRGASISPYSSGKHEMGGDVAFNCAVISQCSAFVGIDSGPSKCASATDTPALVVWTGHHPSPFHDPAPNTTHAVPIQYHGLEPVCDDPGVIRFFEANYNVVKYVDPIESAVSWLRKVLR